MDSSPTVFREESLQSGEANRNDPRGAGRHPQRLAGRFDSVVCDRAGRARRRTDSSGDHVRGCNFGQIRAVSSVAHAGTRGASAASCAPCYEKFSTQYDCACPHVGHFGFWIFDFGLAVRAPGPSIRHTAREGIFHQTCTKKQAHEFFRSLVIRSRSAFIDRFLRRPAGWSATSWAEQFPSDYTLNGGDRLAAFCCALQLASRPHPPAPLGLWTGDKGNRCSGT
jgi:hypothetical protein